MYKRILVAVDGAPGTEQVIEAAIDLARHYDSSLEVIHVVDDAILPLDRHSRRQLVTRESEAERTLERMLDRAIETGVHATGTVERGDPDETILQCAQDWHCDAIVMGARTHHGLTDRVRRSTTERIVRTAPLPVLSVPVDSYE